MGGGSGTRWKGEHGGRRKEVGAEGKMAGGSRTRWKGGSMEAGGRKKEQNKRWQEEVGSDEMVEWWNDGGRRKEVHKSRRKDGRWK
jgi:hypothetical protein